MKTTGGKAMNGKFTFSVFTPTYNRAHLLGRAYESLCRQTFGDFEWIVVDDGSTDGTAALINNWIAESRFPIRYSWQKNSGKGIAMNRGVEKAKGRYLVVLDSDDWLADDCLEKLLSRWNQLDSQKKFEFSGISGLFCDTNGKIVGNPFPKDIIDSDAIEIRTKYKISGDKFGMIKTEILKMYPYPEDLGRYVTPSLVWNRISEKYKIRFVNDIYAYKEYQVNGISDTSIKLRANSPKAAITYYKEFVSSKRNIPFLIKMKNYANYSRFSFHGGVGFSQQAASAHSRIFWSISLPLGFFLFLRDRKFINAGKSTI